MSSLARFRDFILWLSSSDKMVVINCIDGTETSLKDFILWLSNSDKLLAMNCPVGVETHFQRFHRVA